MPVKYGVIGCGAIAQRRHLPEAAANPDSRIVAVADPVKERVEEMAHKYHARPFTDYKEMIRSADIDAVVVCGPNSTHAPMTIDALEAGKHVLCEKPMATTREDALAMIAAAGKSGKYLMIGQNQRLMPAHVRAKEILNTGRLGKPIAFRTAFCHPGPEGWSVDHAKSWFFKKEQAFMGVTGDLGIHKADLMRWLLGQEFAEVGGIITTLDKRDTAGNLIELDDNAYLTLKTNGGLVGAIILSWTNYGAEENYTIVYCTQGVLLIGTDPVWNIIVDYKSGEREMHKVGQISTNEKQVRSGVIDTFTRCILHKTPPEIDGHEGFKSLNVILTAVEAAKQGKVLEIC